MDILPAPTAFSVKIKDNLAPQDILIDFVPQDPCPHPIILIIQDGTEKTSYYRCAKA
jgi:hypothetical protein